MFISLDCNENANTDLSMIYNLCKAHENKIIVTCMEGRKEGNVIFNDMFNTFYLWLYGVRHMIKDHSDSEREETCWHHYKGYSFRLAARVLLYAPSHRQDNTYHSLYYTGHGARNS